MPTATQKLELRQAIADDVAAISEIRKHPLVVPNQFRFQYPLWIEICLTRLNADVAADSFEWRVTTIMLNSKVIGHISEFRTIKKTEFSVQLGWNLHPDYWGQGLMTKALTEFISDLVSNENCKSIVADCFDNNDRCMRLLSRLGFLEASIGKMERILVFIFRFCPHRILRHELDFLDWNATIECSNVA